MKTNNARKPPATSVIEIALEDLIEAPAPHQQAGLYGRVTVVLGGAVRVERVPLRRSESGGCVLDIPNDFLLAGLLSGCSQGPGGELPALYDLAWYELDWQDDEA